MHSLVDFLFLSYLIPMLLKLVLSVGFDMSIRGSNPQFVNFRDTGHNQISV